MPMYFMLNRSLIFLSLIIACMNLVSCGGGGDSSTARLTGAFSDASAVSGLQYSTPSQTGTTDSGGKFSYMPGEVVTFSVGSIVIGKATAAPALTTFSLVGIAAPLTSFGIPYNNPNSLLFQQAINISSFLQTLDSDANPTNGISIPSQATSLAANTTINFKQNNYNFSTAMAFRQFIGLCRTAGVWGAGRAITSSTYAANRLYSGLSLSPSLYATSKVDISSNGALTEYSSYIYDANGNNILNQNFNGSGVLGNSYANTYDANGNLIQTQALSGGVLQTSSTYSYDTNGNLIKVQNFDGGGVLQSYSTYAYDVSGYQTQYKGFNSSGVLQTVGNYTYDADGNLTKQEYFNSSGAPQYSYTSTYNADRNITQSQSLNGSGVVQSSNTYTYDASGNLVQYQTFNGSGVLQSSDTSVYDANGYLTQSQSLNGSGVVQTSNTYIYDANGNNTLSQNYNGSGVLQSTTTNTLTPTTGWGQFLYGSLSG